MLRMLCFVCFALIASHNRTALAAKAQSPGGSNFAWYALTSPSQPAPVTGLNCREPYGIIANYHAAGVRSTVQSQLAAMWAQGQRRLRIPIFHGRGIATGTVMDSNGGNLSATHRQNLQLFLSDIRTAGFAEIVVGFFPVGAFNEPTSWNSWNEPGFQENWNLIVNLRPLIAGAGIHYRIDLLNEGAPTSSQTQLKEYVRKLWINYNLVFGKNDTLGFSIIGDNVNRYQTMRSIMMATGYGLPYLYSVHFYETAVAGSGISNLHAAMQNNGDAQGWIIGEALYQDQPTLDKLRSLNLGTRTIFYLLQWPITRNRGCDGHADVSPPTAFSVYGALHL